MSNGVKTKEWLEGTKVVDLLGNPLVLYHGTRYEFDAFEASQMRLAPGSLQGFFFTSDKSAAQEYGNILLTVFVNLKNPFVGNPRTLYEQEHNLARPGFGSPPEMFAAYKSVTPKAIKALLIEKGFDGVIITKDTSYFDHDEIIAFYPEQIRIMKKNLSPSLELN